MPRFLRVFLAFIIGWALAAGVAGCSSGGGVESPGEGQGGGGGGGGQPTATVTVNFQLARAVPASVTHLRFTGRDAAQAVVFGPQTQPKAAQIVLTVPVTVVQMTVEYLDNGTLVGMHQEAVQLVAGQDLVMDDPEFEDMRWVFRGYTVGTVPGNETPPATLSLSMADVIRLENGTYRMYYGAAVDGGLTAIKYAESNDGIQWTVRGTVLAGSANPADREALISGPSVLRLPNGQYRMYYQSTINPQGGPFAYHVRSAISNDGVNFTREGVRIDIAPFDSTTGLRLAGHGTYFRSANGTYVGIFSGEFTTDPQGPSDLKMATSADGLTFGSFSTLYTDWHDPIVIPTGSGYRMYATYLLEKQGTAFSADGLTWPLSPNDTSFVNANGDPLTEGNSGVGDIGGVMLPSGVFRLFTNFGVPNTDNIVYFEQ
ncbi:MAG: hypothetical protein HY319_25035 [Armatimonadetes bacterium]|nr:hypothetical protein [Armatimonadota bacterium]